GAGDPRRDHPRGGRDRRHPAGGPRRTPGGRMSEIEPALSKRGDDASRRDRWFPNGEWILLVGLAAEIALFALIAPNFATVANFFEISRLGVELGLLALALTPVIITGGIDLSVGAMMGLAAILFGVAWRDWQLPLPAAAFVSLLVGLAGGGLNAILV